MVLVDQKKLEVTVRLLVESSEELLELVCTMDGSQDQGELQRYFRNQVFRIGTGFVGQRLGLGPTHIDGVFDVYMCHQRIKQLDLRLQLEP